MSAGITSIASMTAKPGQGKALADLLRTLIAPSRAEAGCLRYDLHRDQADPDTWVMVEYWASQAALDAHFEMPYLKAFADAAEPLQAGELSMRMLDAVDRGE